MINRQHCWNELWKVRLWRSLWVTTIIYTVMKNVHPCFWVKRARPEVLCCSLMLQPPVTMGHSQWVITLDPGPKHQRLKSTPTSLPVPHKPRRGLGLRVPLKAEQDKGREAPLHREDLVRHGRKEEEYRKLTEYVWTWRMERESNVQGLGKRGEIEGEL